MNSSSLRHRATLIATLVTGVLTLTGVAAAADGDRPARQDPGSEVTQRVATALADRIDATVSADVSGELRVAASSMPAVTPPDESRSVIEHRAAARARSRASIEERAVDNARIYVAIRERGDSGVLVQ